MIDLTEYTPVVLGGLTLIAIGGAYSVFTTTGNVMLAVGTALALGVLGPFFLFYGAGKKTVESASDH